jgi:hypothetical protein
VLAPCRYEKKPMANFGERRRQGETISTAFVESTINQVVSTIRQEAADAVDATGGPIFCCRPGRGSSTRIWTTYSAAGIRNSGRNHKRRSRAARRLDPRPSDALPSESDCKACLNFAIECITHLYFILQRTEVSYKQTPKVQTVSHQASRLKHSCWRPCLDAWSKPTRRN